MSNKPFVYQDPFPLKKDDTEYYLLSRDYVSVAEFAGQEVLKVEPQALTLLAQHAFHDASFMLRPAHQQQVADILNDPEASENDKYVALQFLRNSDIAAKGILPTCQDTGTAIITGKKGNYTQYNASKGVIIATGDYASNREMVKRYSPFTLRADAQIYFPNKCNTGDGHIMALQAGGDMQRHEPHAAVIHLEAGAASYGFLHVNANGERFMNEDVNTQSKSCDKELQPHGVAWSVYDAKWLEQVKSQVDANLAGGLFYGQMWQPWGKGWNQEVEKMTQDAHIKDGKVLVANTLEELAQKMKVPVDNFLKTVKRYNELYENKNDDDYGKRAVLLTPISTGPFYAGKLASTTLTMVGGIRTDSSLQVLDKEGKRVEGLYVVGSAAGEFFANDYPTICPGIGHGRCITFGRMAGIKAAGGDVDKLIPSMKI